MLQVHVGAVARGEQVVHHVALSGISVKKCYKFFIYFLSKCLKDDECIKNNLVNSPKSKKYCGSILLNNFDVNYINIDVILGKIQLVESIFDVIDAKFWFIGLTLDPTVSSKPKINSNLFFKNHGVALIAFCRNLIKL